MPKKKSKRRPEGPLCPVCVYCGRKPGIEDDHVIAEAFFPEPRPRRDEYILVSACSECNRGFWNRSNTRMNMDEEYVRSIFCLEYHARIHPAARRLFQNEVRRSILKNPSIGRLMIHRPRRGAISVESGLIIPGMLFGEVNWLRIRRVIHKIVLGLFYHEAGWRLPDSHITVVEVLSMVGVAQSAKLETHVVQHLMNETRCLGPRRLAGGVFSYAFRQNETILDPASSIWVLSFYDGIYFVVATRPRQGEIASLSPPN